MDKVWRQTYWEFQTQTTNSRCSCRSTSKEDKYINVKEKKNFHNY